ncbi:hypothetical protein B0J11DRAFT_584532 [Dendryphion nanum]|uniref:Uncharacterized protein n=1 Tax=Dendryphion nanum TaxID=256645 RepID=A0A9P9ID79_9PLEO|nr:hypothetical protein B0J11DRAFT_584532 [Dendryphion nanum]
MTTFPSIESSFQFRPHSPIVTYHAPPPEVTSAIESTLKSPISAGIFNVHSSSAITDTSRTWTTSPVVRATPTDSTLTSRPSILSVENAPNGAIPPAQSINPTVGNEEGSKGPKIGVIAGITIVAILALIVAGFCFFGCRRRLKKMKDRHLRQDPGLNMWQTEMRNRRAKKRSGGLWDKLKPTHVPEIDAGQRSSHTINTCVQKDVDTWDTARTGGQGSPSSPVKEQVHQERHMEPEWLPAYRPRERASIISTAGSLNTLGLPIMSAPVVPRT